MTESVSSMILSRQTLVPIGSVIGILTISIGAIQWMNSVYTEIHETRSSLETHVESVKESVQHSLYNIELSNVEIKSDLRILKTTFDNFATKNWGIPAMKQWTADTQKRLNKAGVDIDLPDPGDYR